MVISAQTIDQAELLRSQTAERLQRDRIVTIVNNLSDAIISTDRNGIISLYNASALNLFDTNTDLAGKCIDDFISIVDNNKEPFKFADKLHSAKTTQYRDDLTARISNESIRLGATYFIPRGNKGKNSQRRNTGFYQRHHNRGKYMKLTVTVYLCRLAVDRKSVV